MSRYWKEHGDCMRCYGYGFWHDVTVNEDEGTWEDNGEAYCNNCPAGDKLREYDGVEVSKKEK